MTDTFFSVIIPTYNREDMIKDAIESVLGQTYKNYEIIVIDDGSTDKTSEKVAPYLENINYIKINNSGVSYARNTGVSAAKGDYIAYLDSDDLWLADHLEIMAKTIKKYPDAKVVLSDFKRFNIISQEYSYATNTEFFPIIKKTFAELEDGIYAGNSQQTLFCLMEGYPIFPSSWIISKKIHDHLRWDPGVLKSEDFNLAIKIAKQTGFYYIDKATAVVRMHLTNKSYDSTTKSQVHMATMKMYRDLYCKTKAEKDLANYSIGKRLTALGNNQLKEGGVIKALVTYIKSLGYHQNRTRLIMKIIGKKKSDPTL